MGERNLVEKTQMENGLTLCFYDCSKALAGGRWLVAFECDQVVALMSCQAPPEGASDADLALVARVHGRSLVKTQRRERNFISDEEHSSLLKTMIAEFKQGSLAYLAKTGYPGGMIASEARAIRTNPWKYSLDPSSLS